AVAEYEAFATSLAFLRHRGRRGRAGAEFVVRERELLDALWSRRLLARPALEYAARSTAPPPMPGPAYTAGPPLGYIPPQGYAPPQGYTYAPPVPAYYNPYLSG
ncbi:PrsW family intramembrane metalloprotease, partial [Streptomyces sp. T-3]|nr:PrsW family intramembrane metalloprotease [Streptomyces sp. T-3]